MDLTFIMGAIIAFGIALGGAYVKGRVDGRELGEVAKAREERVAQIAWEASQRSAAEAIAKLTITHTTIKQRVEREVYEKPIYRECTHSPDGMRWVNAALEGTVTVGASKLSRELGEAGKRDVRGNDK